jgi:hypothetical protein
VDVPYIVGGDFNILRHVIEKNKPCVLPHSFEVFNNGIYSLPLEKFSCRGEFIPSLSIKETLLWKNLIECLMSSDLEDLFLLVTITKVVKDQSDHSFT